ncbi:DnaJ-domain-containing protein [Coemansia reversa NRRL 1564]|uniref:DnaJ-domain-containing protein n=1 Tax=Coemansia reversa (strain ATCC 12441 / NRRL 1564) TaxID=763665 RepID=A0A2G5BIL8_COERN|nr:DnaJ-domain-containing protein [Coemansia reversa NRRL 1564]|eukprot:PIA18607.1 DnaJ-domain-containing protein [Coemansia reversa NRRL 1564]
MIGFARRMVHIWNEAERIIARLNTDAYKTLGVDENSTYDEIKQQYYRVCRQLHPDTQTSNQTQVPSLLHIDQVKWQHMSTGQRQAAMREQFAVVRDAYEILSDANVRRWYDAHRRQRFGIGLRSWRPTTTDVWASERPGFAGGESGTAQKQHERLTKWGLFGFLGVLLLVGSYQRQLNYEDQRLFNNAEHLRAMQTLSTARGRAMEKWREVPPDHMREYEYRRLDSARAITAAAMGKNLRDTEVVRQGEFHKLWPHGSGLGLVALLNENQLCGIYSRRRAATDRTLSKSRLAAQNALVNDRIVRKYMELPPQAHSQMQEHQHHE